MEAPTEKLQVFSSLLLQQHIRLVTAAVYWRSDEQVKTAVFAMTAENYAQMMAEPLQALLINLQLDYDAASERLTVTGNDKFFAEYANPNMKDVALQHFEKYHDRYADYIRFVEN